MSKVTIPIAITKDSNNWFVLSDTHGKDRNKNLIDKLINLALNSKPRERNLLLLGDILDFAFLMKKHPLYSKWMKINTGMEDYFIPKYDDEIQEGNDLLDLLEKTFKRIIYIGGNHEDPRITDLINACPSQYRYYFDLKKSLRLKERGIIFIDYNDWLDIGDLSLTHGGYHGPSSANKHFLASGARSVMHGHEHQYKVTPMVSRGQTKYVYSMPCCTNLNPEYIKNRETNHDEGIGQIRFNMDGSFQVFCYILQDGKITLQNGKVL